MSAMYCYLWYEKDKPNECKFGERWIKNNQVPEDEVWKRIRNSVGVRKDLVNDGTIVLEAIWDVSDYAKRFNRFYMHGKVDDHIRPIIGFRKGKTGEVHSLPAEDVRIKVNNYLASFNQKLQDAGLSQPQYNALKEILESFNSGSSVVMAELCARFGKTIWSGALIKETNMPITVVVSYVLTSFSSFIKELTSYEQFKHMVLVDTKDRDYELKINKAIKSKKQVVALVSMCNGQLREERLNFLKSKRLPKLVLIDEADYGVHRKNQSTPLLNIVKNKDKVVIMTGTNGDRAVSSWKINKYMSVTYPELIIDKRDNLPAIESPLIKHFHVNTKRRELVVDLQFYQMNIRNVIKKANIDDAFVEDGDFLPSWAKFAAYPYKAKGFFTNMLQAIFEGKHNLDSLNIDFQTSCNAEEIKDRQKVSMMFLPGNMTNMALLEAQSIAKDALKGYDIVTVSGGVNMTNASAEREVKEQIEKAKQKGNNVLILSTTMAQRSFSVGDITELFLAYDNGDNGATIQKMSRALTPNIKGKVGKVISLSFDPNRDDKFDTLILETAQNYQKKANVDNLKDSLKYVLKTVDIFNCSENGAEQIEVDNFIKNCLDKNSIDRIIGKMANLEAIDEEDMLEMLESAENKEMSEKTEVAAKGKTNLISKRSNHCDKKTDTKTIDQIREMIANTSKHLDVIKHQTDGTFDYSLEWINKMYNVLPLKDIECDLGMPFSLFYKLYTKGVFNQDLISLKFN